MYLYTLKQLIEIKQLVSLVVNRFKKNVSLHVETTENAPAGTPERCESL